MFAKLALFPQVKCLSSFHGSTSMADFPNKRFKSTLTTHHGALVWVLEEIEPEQPPVPPAEPNTGRPNVEDHMGEEMDHMLSLLATANIPGSSLCWDKDEGWKFDFPKDPEPVPEKISFMMEQEDGEITNMPPIKYFDEEGKPVYYFSDPITGHKYWEECECDACIEDCMLNNEGMTPQQLREFTEWEKQQEELSKTAPSKEEEDDATSSFKPTPPS